MESKLAAAMFIVGSIGLFVHYIPLPPAVIALCPGPSSAPSSCCWCCA